MKATYQIDPAHSSAHFSVRHMMITNVRGSFRSVSGQVTFDPDNVANSSIDATIDAASINTNDEQRDTHLKSAEFLDVARFPTITFHSKSLEAAGDGEVNVRGDLSIHGITREVVLTVDGPTAEGKDPWGNVRIGASGATRIKRSDFGLTWNVALEAGGFLVGDELRIDLEISLVKSATAAA